MRLVIIASIVSASFVAFAACGSGGGGSATPTVVPSFTLTGVMTLVVGVGDGWSGKSYLKYTSDGSEAATAEPPSSSCVGPNGYSDLHEGAQVTVKDDQSAIVGLGQFSSGTVAMGVPRETGEGFAKQIKVLYKACQFSFTVSGLPRRPFYAISTGTRSGVTYSFDDLQSANWTVALTIGGG